MPCERPGVSLSASVEMADSPNFIKEVGTSRSVAADLGAVRWAGVATSRTVRSENVSLLFSFADRTPC